MRLSLEVTTVAYLERLFGWSLELANSPSLNPEFRTTKFPASVNGHRTPLSNAAPVRPQHQYTTMASPEAKISVYSLSGK